MCLETDTSPVLGKEIVLLVFVVHNIKPTLSWWSVFFCFFTAADRMKKILSGLLLAVTLFSGLLFYVPNAEAGARILTVASASSLSYALKEAGRIFEAGSGIKLRFSFASTGVLASQIENGAPFDLFIAADKKYAVRLESSGNLEPDSVITVADGALAIVVNRASGLGVKSLEDLGRVGTRVAIANPAHAPYGTAAVQALKKAGVWQSVQKRLVYGENVRQALQFVESGNAAVGLVALSIARTDGVYIVPVPRTLYSPVEHAAGIVTRSPNRKEAVAFINFLQSPEAVLIFNSYGFTIPEQEGSGK